MNYYGKIGGLILALIMSALPSLAQDDEPTFVRDNWSISVEGGMSVVTPDEQTVVGGSSHDEYRSKTDGGALMANFTWHPFKSATQRWSDMFFTRFGAGIAYDHEKSSESHGNREHVMFKMDVMLGYTFRVSRAGIDIFTGPSAKIGFKNYMISSSTSGGGTEVTSETNYYPGGADWRFGVGVNVEHVGFYVTYNQPMGDFYHVTRTIVGIAEDNWGLKDRGSLSFGFIYRF